jgi:hypothetical protein
MAFSWSSLSAGDPIEASDFNEVKTNLDSIFTALGISPDPAWTGEWDLQAGDSIKSAHAQELRDKTDYADNNWCTTHYATHKTTHQTTHYSSHLNGYNNGYKSTHYSSNLATHNSGYESTDNGTHNNFNNGAYYSTYYEVGH